MQQRDLLHGAIEVLPGRLFYNSYHTVPPKNGTAKWNGRNIDFFSIDEQLVYWNFFSDFGPLNLGQLYRFCEKLNVSLGLGCEYSRSVRSLLATVENNSHVVCFYSGMRGERRANAIFLICAWQIIYLDRTPEEAFQPFRRHTLRSQENTIFVGKYMDRNGNVMTELQLEPIPPFHDASPGVCTYDLTVLDVLRGLAKARTYGFFQDFKRGHFSVEEYEHFEMVENGDLNWIIDGQFLAFAGPQNRREVSREGYVTLTPEDYIDYFIKRNIGLVVRLNKKCYDESKFLRFGIGHVEHYYLDGSCPSKSILNQVVQSFEKCIFDLPLLQRTGKGVAVHCKAGLGRTGTCIGAFMMKHYKFTASEAIGWMRLCRPGMVIGPQQHFLKDIQQEMWHSGEIMRAQVRRSLELGKGTSSTIDLNVPALASESPDRVKQDHATLSDKKKRRSSRLKLSTSGFKSAFHSIGVLSTADDEINDQSQGDALRAAHSKSHNSPTSASRRGIIN